MGKCLFIFFLSHLISLTRIYTFFLLEMIWKINNAKGSDKAKKKSDEKMYIELTREKKIELRKPTMEKMLNLIHFNEMNFKRERNCNTFVSPTTKLYWVTYPFRFSYPYSQVWKKWCNLDFLREKNKCWKNCTKQSCWSEVISNWAYRCFQLAHETWAYNFSYFTLWSNLLKVSSATNGVKQKIGKIVHFSFSHTQKNTYQNELHVWKSHQYFFQ